MRSDPSGGDSHTDSDGGDTISGNSGGDTATSESGASGDEDVAAGDHGTLPLDADVDHDELTIVSEALYEQLSPPMALVVDTALNNFEDWMREMGRSPQRNKGLSESTVQNNLRRIDQILRFCLEEGIIPDEKVDLLASDEAKDEFVQRLAANEMTKSNGEPYDEGSRRKFVDVLKKLNEYRVYHHDIDPWECDVSFSATTHESPDYFTEEEFATLRAHARDYSRLPPRSELSPEERLQYRREVAQRLSVPLEAVDERTWHRLHEDFERRSLFLVTMDTGLRPVEVRRAKTDWLRLDKGVLHIPREDAAKSEASWEPVLRDETVTVLQQWLDQRSTLARYAGSDRLWLNNAGNPFQSGPLNDVFDSLLETADISRENRDLTWYSLRHTVGEHVREHGDIRHAKEQLRQKSEAALLQYGGPSVEKRQETLRSITCDE